MPTEQTITFLSNANRLTGTLHLPAIPKAPIVIGCHGLFANRHSPKQIALARACNREGIAYFRFDHAGCGDSHGEFAKVTTLNSRCRDLYWAIKAIRAHPALGTLVGLFGSSFGGTVVLAHAAAYASPALITYASPIDSASIQHSKIRDNHGEPPPSDLLTDSLQFDIAPKLKSIGNILIAHSEGDETVPVDHARQIHRQVAVPKKLLIFKNGDHRMSDPNHQQEFENQFLQWLKSDIE